MTHQQLIQIGLSLRKWFFLLKSDPETLAESRKLVLGVVASLVFLYAGDTILLSPLRQALAQKQAQLQELTTTTPPQVVEALAGQAARLENEQRSLNEQAEILALQVRFLEEQWRAVTSPEQFTKVVFTLQPNVPVNMEKHLDKMTQQENRTENGATFSTITLSGEASFRNLHAYLRYLEGRTEVSLIEALSIERLPAPAQEQAKVKFSMVVGRTVLEKTP